jgi:hypothetical protein
MQRFSHSTSNARTAAGDEDGIACQFHFSLLDL